MLPPPRTTADIPSGEWDVVVAGAGPAGATVASHVARAGHRVLLLDRRGFPRDKVCGDGLIADTLGALERLAALPAVRALARAVARTSIYSASRHRIEIDGEFLTLKRRDLDAIIASRAVADGAVMATATVADVQPDPTGVTVRLAGAQPAALRARYAVLATGADILPGRRAGLSTSSSPSAVAVRCYVRSSARVDRLVISYDRAIIPGYAWIFPLRDDEYNVGCGLFYRHGVRGDVNLRTMFERFVATFPEARELMRGAITTTPLKGAPLRCGLTGIEAPGVPRVLAIGETVGTTFPFTGEGIGKAMETGELAAETLQDALDADDPRRLEGFSATVKQVLGPKYRGYRAAERWLSRPWVTDLLARRARRSHFLRDALGGILNETIDPKTVFSISGLARSLFS
jgi:geranylgeranyl reductase family protein